ncbi:hypothetical protein L798_14628 [Zootermopsis nevadensis]|uniref:Uncharacterized protein n=1 Tax=Zootermopsis nevadensis TaxID=136037 RepID=A0A067QR09_ZOONE|nr:hypothetical protein L798_14628 [Zootermopsis nevadensis]
MECLYSPPEVIEYGFSFCDVGLSRDIAGGKSVIGFQRTPFFALELLPELPIELFLLTGINLGKLLNFPIKALLRLRLSLDSVRLEMDEMPGLTLSKLPLKNN